MKIITYDDIKKLNIKKELFFEWAREAFLNKNNSILPPKTSLKFYEGDGFINTMPTIIPQLSVYGVKVVSRNPHSVPVLKSNIMLFDLKNNDLLSVMDADYITAFRTGATATLAIETLAKKDYSSIGVIGLGNICRATLLVLLSIVKKPLTIKLFMFEGKDNGIIDLISPYPNVTIETHDNIKDTIVDSDVVISCVTYAKEDLAKPQWFKNGSLLVPIHTRGFLNCDLEFDRIIVDDREHVCGFKNYNNFKNCHELSEVLYNNAFGRANDKERIIAYNIGISILDISFAKHVYDLVKTKKDVCISSIKELYWVN